MMKFLRHIALACAVLAIVVSLAPEANCKTTKKPTSKSSSSTTTTTEPTTTQPPATTKPTTSKAPQTSAKHSTSKKTSSSPYSPSAPNSYSAPAPNSYSAPAPNSYSASAPSDLNRTISCDGRESGREAKVCTDYYLAMEVLDRLMPFIKNYELDPKGVLLRNMPLRSFVSCFQERKKDTQRGHCCLIGPLTGNKSQLHCKRPHAYEKKTSNRSYEYNLLNKDRKVGPVHSKKSANINMKKELADKKKKAAVKRANLVAKNNQPRNKSGRVEKPATTTVKPVSNDDDE